MFKGMKKHANTKEKEKNIMTEPGFEPVILSTDRFLVLYFNHQATPPSYYKENSFDIIYIVSESDNSFQNFEISR